MTSEKFSKLSQEIVVWGARNFGDKKDSAMGVAEELGELCKCLLKRVQGIRGFDDPDFFMAEAADALADTMVYLLHLCGDRGFTLYAPQPSYLARTRMRVLVARALRAAAALLEAETAENAQDILDLVNALAQSLQINLEEALDKTWAKVAKRDWVVNPKNAHDVAEQS